MVDFNNETTVTTAPGTLVKLMILERRKYVLDALEWYYKKVGSGVCPDSSILHGRIIAFFYEVQATLERDLPNYDNLKELVFSSEINKLREALEILNKWCDTKKLTKIDNIKTYDSTDAELENMEKGM